MSFTPKVGQLVRIVNAHPEFPHEQGKVGKIVQLVRPVDEDFIIRTRAGEEIATNNAECERISLFEYLTSN